MTDGRINPATEELDPGERPAVWCSTDPVWEATATKGQEHTVVDLRTGRVRRTGTTTCTLDEMRARGGELARIAVRPEAAPYTWSDFRRLSGASPRMLNGMRGAAEAVGASPWAWRVAFAPIARGDWLQVERESAPGRWADMDPSAWTEEAA